jgi:hypothetical protein
MWERADGVPAMSCLPSHERFTNRGLGTSLRLGAGVQGTLYGAGQPLSRPGRSFRYCAGASAARAAAVSAVFDARGRVAMIASSARGHSAGGAGPGTPVASIARRSTPSIHGVLVGPRRPGGARYVYGVRGGRIRFVAVAAASELRTPERLRSDLRAAGV